MSVNDEKGFSLLELIIAISLLTVGLLGAATMLSTGIGGGRFANTLTIEKSIASAVIEELASRDPSDAIFDTDVAGAVYDLDVSSAATTRTVQGRTFSANYDITTSNPVAGATLIVVTVTSTGRSATITHIKSTI